MDKLVKCEYCHKEFDEKYQYAHYSGYYCSKECYSTLFEICLDCGQNNMLAKTNRIEYGEKLCDNCYNKKHGLAVVSIGNSSMKLQGHRQ